MYSLFREDLMKRMALAIGKVRRDAWGEPDMTGNPALSVYTQLAALYTVQGEFFCPDGGQELADLVIEAGFWGLMARVQRDTLAFREMCVRVEVTDEGKPTFRPIFPDMCVIETDPRDPNTILMFRELCWSGLGWVWHELEIRPEKGGPYYHVLDEQGRDVTEAVLGAPDVEAVELGQTYPYVNEAGEAFIPVVLYHAAHTGQTWDPWAYSEVFEGSLNVGVLLTFYQHLVKNAAWAQRWVMGARPVGAEVEGDSGSERHVIVADPATVLGLEPTDSDREVQPQVGQWTSPIDTAAIFDSICLYERRILLLAGVQPPDVTRQDADIRSGYSLAVSREAVREQQRAFEPQFRMGDLTLIRMVAWLLRVRTGRILPATGYRIAYRALPRSPAELAAEREHLLKLLEQRLIDRATVYMRLNPGIGPEEAEAALAEIAMADTPTETGLTDAQLSALLQISQAAASGQIAPAAGAALMRLAVPGIDEASAAVLSTPVRPTTPTTF